MRIKNILRNHKKKQNTDCVAAKNFIRKTYSTYSVKDCLEKWGIDTRGSVTSGEEKIKAAQGISKGSTEAAKGN